MYSDWEDVTSSSRAFQVFGPATGKTRLPTVDRLTGGTRRRLVPVEQNDHLPGRLRAIVIFDMLRNYAPKRATSEEWPTRQ